MNATWDDAVSPGPLVAIAGLLGLGKLFEVLGCLLDNIPLSALPQPGQAMYPLHTSPD